MVYSYSSGNLLQEKPVYNFAPFGGVSFLAAYHQSRQDWIRRQDSTGATDDYAGLSAFLGAVEKLGISDPAQAHALCSIPANDGETIEASSYLQAVFFAYRTAATTENTRLPKLLQRFEVTKRLWSVSDAEFRPVAGAVADRVELYVLFSVCCLAAYNRTRHLSFLNGALKANDIVCSQTGLPRNTVVGRLARLALNEELQAVADLGRAVGVPAPEFSR